MKKKILIIACLILSIFLFTEIRKTFSLFETVGTGQAENKLAKWQIKINNTDITNLTEKNNTFPLGNINWENQEHVKIGKAAPGSIGKFDILINPTGTDVSFIYDLTFDLTSLDNTEFNITSVKEVNGKELVRTDKGTYAGIASLTDIKKNTIYHIEVSITWNNNEENNEKDYNLGKIANQDIDIPVSIEVRQYDGEEQLIEYKEG